MLPISSGYGPETVVVSGSGIEIIPSTGKLPLTPQTYSGTVASGVRALEEFDPSQVRGSYQVATILFNNGSSRLNSRDKRILSRVVAEQKKTGGTLRIVGHASSRTQTMDLVRHKLVNFKISAARANVILKELVRLGINPNYLFVGSVSDTMPRYRESMPSGEAGNRRAEIFVCWRKPTSPPRGQCYCRRTRQKSGSPPGATAHCRRRS